MQNKKTLITLLAISIIALGFFLRIYNIENAPPGIYPDEAVNGEDALRANSTGEYRWFYPANQGREGLFMNLIALCFKLLGTSILSLKLPAILFGTLTIWGTYLLGQELFHNRRTASLAAFFTAISFWAINFSRISFRANMLPFVLVFIFYFLFKGLRTHRKLDFILGGAFFGLGLHTYIAFRITPLILLVMLIVFTLSRRHFLSDYWKHILLFLLTAILVAWPMIHTFWTHPEYLESRSENISVFSTKMNGGHPLSALGRGIFLSLQKYTFVGDFNWRHNYPPYPLLDPLTGLAFLIGIYHILITISRRLFLRISRQKHRESGIEVHIFLLVWFLAMLAPEFLTAEGLPHALRSIGTLPVVMLLAAAGANLLWERSDRYPLRTRQTISWLAITLLVFIGAFNAAKYHLAWASQEKTALSFNKNLTQIGKSLKHKPPQTETYVVTSFNTLERLPIFVLNPELTNVVYLFPDQLGRIQPRDPENFSVYLTERNLGAIQEIQTRFPRLSLHEVIDQPGSVYYIISPN